MGNGSSFLTELSPPSRGGTIRIEISGPMAIGKSMVAHVIRRALLEAGVDSVEFVVPDPATHEMPTAYLLPETFRAPAEWIPGWLGDRPQRRIEIVERQDLSDRAVAELIDQICVNGKYYIYILREISYETVVALAFPDAPRADYTMSYALGPPGAASGSMVFGNTVKVRTGMCFNVALTTNS